MDTAEFDANGHVVGSSRTVTAPRRSVSVRREQLVPLRRAPRFYLTYLPNPNDGTDPALPLGSCLVLKCIGGRPPRDVVVDLPTGAVRHSSKLRRESAIGIATPAELEAVVGIGTVFVEWVSRDGVTRTSWVKVPPIPARYLDRSAR
ncbi:hypothetical protein ACPEEZ_12295 [Frigoribacterium sp. 2-23]|uniref:hypothetical protein n=1 Tax=Frigoribacterium sp. 2-23 TaxID=3415006 RepID=UPI003C6FEF81